MFESQMLHGLKCFLSRKKENDGLQGPFFSPVTSLLVFFFRVWLVYLSFKAELVRHHFFPWGRFFSSFSLSVTSFLGMDCSVVFVEVLFQVVKDWDFSVRTLISCFGFTWTIEMKMWDPGPATFQQWGFIRLPYTWARLWGLLLIAMEQAILQRKRCD